MSSSSSSSYGYSSSSSTELRSSSSSSSTEIRSSSSTEIRSSSSSSSSSSSYIENWSSSSESSDILITLPIYLPLINQNNGDLIPFTWIAEGGVAGDGTSLNFTIEASNGQYFDYNAIINRDNGYILSTPSTTPTVYIPNSDSSKYQHEKSFYVDVIGKDLSGIKEIRTHTEPNGYDFVSANAAGTVFQMPKFTWDTNVASSITTIKEVVLVGTSNNALVDVEYNTNSASIAHSKDLGSSVAGIIFAEQTNKEIGRAHV